MHDLIVREIVQQRVRHRVRIADQKYRGARHAMRRILKQHFQEWHELQRRFAQVVEEYFAPVPPRDHDGKDNAAHRKREPPAFDELEQVRGEKRSIHDQEEARRQHAQRKAVAPAEVDHEKREYRRDQHGARYGQAVRRRET